MKKNKQETLSPSDAKSNNTFFKSEFQNKNEKNKWHTNLTINISFIRPHFHFSADFSLHPNHHILFYPCFSQPSALPLFKHAKSFSPIPFFWLLFLKIIHDKARKTAQKMNLLEFII